MESILKCCECQKTSSYEEVKIVSQGGRNFWVCPHYDFETPIVEQKATHLKITKKV